MEEARWGDAGYTGSDLIEEYWININLAVLGNGKPLFAGVTQAFHLMLLEAQTFKSGVVALRYEPDRT